MGFTQTDYAELAPPFWEAVADLIMIGGGIAGVRWGLAASPTNHGMVITGIVAIMTGLARFIEHMSVFDAKGYDIFSRISEE